MPDNKKKTESIIEVKNLKKKYGKNVAVDNISFSVKKGEVFGILGPNGAGKTTTLEMMEALRDIGEGDVHIDGISVKKRPRKVKSIIGVQLQSPAFYDKITLTEQLRLFASFYGKRVDAQALLEEVELKKKEGSFPEKLSGGQRQRFSVAVALVNDPEVLFLDEPTTGLDPQSRRHMWDLIERINDKGITVVITTHYMEEAELLCDRVAIMDEGKIIALDTPDNLVNNLLEKGFRKKKEVKQADLEDVFIDLTGKALRE